MPENGCGTWNERAMPLRQRRSGGRRGMSSPAKITRPASGATVPAAMPNSVVLPAPFGPMMPSASPSASARSTLSATTTAPNRFEIFSSARIGAMVSIASADRLQLASERNFRRGLVRGDHQLGLAGLALPLPGDQRGLGDVLHRRPGPVDRPNHRLVVCGYDRLQDRLRIAQVLGALEHVDSPFEQRVLEADWLRPRPVGRLGVAVGELLGALAGKAGRERVTRRPPVFAGESV